MVLLLGSTHCFFFFYPLVGNRRLQACFSNPTHTHVLQSLSVLRTNSHACATEVLLLDQAWRDGRSLTDWTREH